MASDRRRQRVGLGPMIANGWIGIGVRLGTGIAVIVGASLQTRLTGKSCCWNSVESAVAVEAGNGSQEGELMRSSLRYGIFWWGYNTVNTAPLL